MKKTVGLICSLALLLILFAGGSVSASAEMSGDFRYTVLDESTVEINGYTGSSAEVVIPSVLDGYTVTAIGDIAFLYSSITSITFPDTLTTLGVSVFEGCRNLASITVGDANPVYSSVDGVLFNKDKTTLLIYPAAKADAVYTAPDSVTQIASNAFSYSIYMETVRLPDGLQTMDAFAFKYSSLQYLTVPDSVTSIGQHAFDNCNALVHVELPASLTYLGEAAFAYCARLKSVAIPKGIETLEVHTFLGCTSLESVTLPAALTRIEDTVFEDCTSLTKVAIPDGVTFVGNGAFYNCQSLATVIVPASVAVIGGEAFYNCHALTSIRLPATVDVIGYHAFYVCNSLTIYGYADSCAEEYAAEEGVPFALIGELTGDSKVDAEDVLAVFGYINRVVGSDAAAFAAADITGDGKVNLHDAARLFYTVNGLI